MKNNSRRIRKTDYWTGEMLCLIKQAVAAAVAEVNTVGNIVELKAYLLYLCMKYIYFVDGFNAILDIDFIRKAGYVDKLPKKSTIKQYENSGLVETLLHRMIQFLAKKTLEKDSTVCIDSTLFLEITRRNTLSANGKLINEKRWIKAHMISGSRTRLVLGIHITPSTVHDLQVFKPLLKQYCSKYGVPCVITADRAYCARSAANAAASVGVVPHFKIKKYTALKGKGCPAWYQMVSSYYNNREEYLLNYRARHNIEACFLVLKNRFGSVCWTKRFQSQANEILAKVVCYNALTLTG